MRLIIFRRKIVQDLPLMIGDKIEGWVRMKRFIILLVLIMTYGLLKIYLLVGE